MFSLKMCRFEQIWCTFLLMLSSHLYVLKKPLKQKYKSVKNVALSGSAIFPKKYFKSICTFLVSILFMSRLTSHFLRKVLENFWNHRLLIIVFTKNWPSLKTWIVLDCSGLFNDFCYGADINELEISMLQNIKKSNILICRSFSMLLSALMLNSEVNLDVKFKSNWGV